MPTVKDENTSAGQPCAACEFEWRSCKEECPQPCTECEFQSRSCNEDCPLAPHFSAQDSEKLQSLHNVFELSNVAKILRSLNTEHEKSTAVECMFREAQLRKKYPIEDSWGCIHALHQQIVQEYLIRVENQRLEIKNLTLENERLKIKNLMLENLRLEYLSQQDVNRAYGIIAPQQYASRVHGIPTPQQPSIAQVGGSWGCIMALQQQIVQEYAIMVENQRLEIKNLMLENERLKIKNLMLENQRLKNLFRLYANTAGRFAAAQQYASRVHEIPAAQQPSIAQEQSYQVNTHLNSSTLPKQGVTGSKVDMHPNSYS